MSFQTNAATMGSTAGFAAPGQPGDAGRGKLYKRLLRNPVAVIAITILVLIVLSAVFAGVLAPHNPNHADPSIVRASMSASHPLGTDGAGRDVLSRLLYSGRLTLAAAALSLVIALVLGVAGGLIGAYFGGFFDSALSWVSNLLMAIPGIIVLLAVVASLGTSIWTAMAVFGILMAPQFYRLTYATVNAVKNELYVDAARVAGISDRRIIARHILSVVRAPIIIQTAMVGGIAIGIESGLAFLGVVNTNELLWGNMLNDAFQQIYSDANLVIWPSLMIGLTCVSLALLANALRDALEETTPKAHRRKRKGAGAPKHRPLVAETAAAVTPEAVEAAKPTTEATIVHADLPGTAADTREKLLDVKNLAVGYEGRDGAVRLVVNDASLLVHRGEVHGLIGESGSGKTQTAFAVMGVLPEGGRIVDGEVWFEGNDLQVGGPKAFAAVRGQKIGYIPQEPMSNLDPTFTVGSQLVEPLRRTLGMSKEDATKKALDLLERVGIPDPKRTFKAYPHEISGGMAQRVLIAGAVSCEPDLLIADEPTTALDVTVQAEVLDLLRELQKESDMGLVLVTHNFGVVADICDRVSVMQQGMIVETGPVAAIFAEPKHPYTQSLFDAIVDKDEPDISVDELETAAGAAGEAKS